MFKKVLLLMGLLVSLTSTVWAEDANLRYVHCYEDSKATYYFDTKTIRFIPNDVSPTDIVDVWIKVSFTDKGKELYLNISKKGEEYKDFAYSLLQLQMRFSSNEFISLMRIDYTPTEAIKCLEEKNQVWKPIPPGSPGEHVLDTIKRYLDSQKNGVSS